MKSQVSFRRFLVGTLLFCGLFWSQASFAQEATAEAMGTSEEMGEAQGSVSEEDLAAARLHFSNGVELLQAEPPNFQDAYYQFLSALQKSGGSWKVQGNLGYCSLKLERDGEALVHYREYLAKGGDEVAAGERDAIEKELLLIEGNMATVLISSSDPKAQITVQRKNSSVSAQAYELSDQEVSLGLRSGEFVITARNDNKTLTWQPILTPGKEFSHHFDFVESNAATAAPAEGSNEGQAGAQPESGTSPLRTWGYVTGGVGILTLGGGLVAGLLSQSKEEKAKEGCVGTICPSAGESSKNSAQTLATTANILLISGGVLAAAGITMVIVGGKSKNESASHASLHLTPGVQLGGGALFAAGTF